jgi:hypothetical protein
MAGTEDCRLQEDEELSKLVAAYVVARDDAGAEPHMGDFTEEGFTDFDYICVEGLSPFEILGIGMNIAREAAGREAWATYDGVGYRVFFGPLEEVKARICERLTVLEVMET